MRNFTDLEKDLITNLFDEAITDFKKEYYLEYDLENDEYMSFSEYLNKLVVKAYGSNRTIRYFRDITPSELYEITKLRASVWYDNAVKKESEKFCTIE